MQPLESVQVAPDIKRPRKPAGMPRRFGVGTLLVLTAVYAGLFGVLKMLGAHPVTFAAIATFFTGIGLAQMLLFGGKKPRQASALAGMVLWFLITGVSAVVVLGFPFVPLVLLEAPTLLLPLILSSVMVGAPLGYMAGVLIAGVFLVMGPEKEETDDRPTEIPAADEEPARGTKTNAAPRRSLD